MHCSLGPGLHTDAVQSDCTIGATQYARKIVAGWLWFPIEFFYVLRF